MGTLYLGFLSCSLFSYGSRVGSFVRVAISPLATYGYIFHGGLVGGSELSDYYFSVLCA